MLVVDPPVPCPSELDRCTGTWAHWRNVVQPRNIDSFKYCLGWQFQIFICMFSYPDLTQDYVWDGSNCLSPQLTSCVRKYNMGQRMAGHRTAVDLGHFTSLITVYVVLHVGCFPKQWYPKPLAHPWRTNHLEKCLVSPLKAPYLWRSEMFNGLTWGHGPSGARWWLLPIGGNHFVVIELIAKFVNYNLLGGLNHFLFFHILGIVIPTD